MLEPAPDVLDARHDGGADFVHDDIGVSLEQRHDRGDLGNLGALRRRGEDVGQAIASAPEGVRRVLGDLQDLLAELLGVRGEVQRELAGRVDHVLAQPRHGGELNAVRFLVQADPESEVRGVDADVRFGLQHVGRHEHQPGRAVGGEVVLTQDLARQEGHECARLGAGHLATDLLGQVRTGLHHGLALGQHRGDDRL